MTFEAWYSSTIAPQLEQSLKPLPKVVHEQLRKASRETYVLCWNAALDAASEYKLPASAEEIVTHIYEVRA